LTGNIQVWNAKDGAVIGQLSTNPLSLTKRIEATTQSFTATEAAANQGNAALAAINKGIADRKAASLEKLLGRNMEQKEVAPRIAKHLGELLGREMKETSKKELLEKLEHAEQAVAISA